MQHTGQIPASLGWLGNLQELYLHSNNLSGEYLRQNLVHDIEGR